MWNYCVKMDDEDSDDVTASWSKNGSWSSFDFVNISEVHIENVTGCTASLTSWNAKSTSEIAIKTSATFLMVTIGMYLNFVILFVLFKNKSLWNPSNFLIGNLAFVDLVALLFCPWFMLIRDLYEDYLFGYYGCKLEEFFEGILLLANVGAVMLVSYDRVAAAALTMEARVTKAGAPKLIAISWAASFCIALPLFFANNYEETECWGYVKKTCTEDVRVLSIYWHFVLLLLVWIPLGVMLITYGTIIWRLEKTLKKLKSRGGGQAVTKAKDKALRVTACVLLTDIVCRLPYSLLVYFRSSASLYINNITDDEEPNEYIWFTAQFLMYANCAFNSLLYGFTNTKFRKAMDKTPGVSCCKFGSWCCVWNPRKKNPIDAQDKSTQKIFIIETSPRPTKKIKKLVKKVLHINKDEIDFSTQKVGKGNFRQTCITSVPVENV